MNCATHTLRSLTRSPGKRLKLLPSFPPFHVQFRPKLLEHQLVNFLPHLLKAHLGVCPGIKLPGFLLCLRQHLPERLQALAHFAQGYNRASVVAFGFSSGKQFPSFSLHAPHVVKQAVAKTLFPVLARLHDGLSNVALVA